MSGVQRDQRAVTRQPNGNFGTVAFGTMTAAHDPRVFELVLKLHF